VIIYLRKGSKLHLDLVYVPGSRVPVPAPQQVFPDNWVKPGAPTVDQITAARHVVNLRSVSSSKILYVSLPSAISVQYLGGTPVNSGWYLVRAYFDIRHSRIHGFRNLLLLRTIAVQRDFVVR